VDRIIVYGAAIPEDYDVLNVERNAMIALGFLMQATFGSSTLADGLACAPTLVPSMSVGVGPGSVMTLLTVDSSAFGSLAADTADALVKMGINLTATAIGPFTAPGTAGQSQNFLIQAQVSETDGTPVVLQYFNPAPPYAPFAGPANSDVAQNTWRRQAVLLEVKAGAPATTGSQTTPTPDAGFVGLYQLTIANGATTIISGNIALYPGAPFIPAKLGPGMVPGFSHAGSCGPAGSLGGTGTTDWTVPAGIYLVRSYGWSGGGGGGGAQTGAAASGGNGGGRFDGIYAVTPGQVISVVAGAGGTGGVNTGGTGTPGGISSFGTLASAPGGLGGIGAVTGSAAMPPVPNAAPTGGTVLNLAGSQGSSGLPLSSYMGGSGGDAALGGSGGAYATTGAWLGTVPGGGGSGGGGNGANAGGGGAAGMVIVEW
jgi:hypothetical protein